MTNRDESMGTKPEKIEKEEDDIFTVVKLEDKDERPSVGKEILETVLYIALVVVTAWFILYFVVQRTEVSGNSMLPNLHNGESIMIDKISYRFKDPERFDIIVFNYLYTKDTHYIKRIIGLPGETVQIIDGVIYIDGAPLEENYGLEAITNPGRAAEPITLGPDEYFVLGDNRNGSSDSRSEDVANVSRKQIVGRAWLRIWPLDVFGFIHH